MTLLRPGRKRSCYKRRHSFHEATDGALVCSKCGFYKDVVMRMYEGQVLQAFLAPVPPVFQKMSGGKTITFFRVTQ